MLTDDFRDALILEPHGIHDIERDVRERRANDVFSGEILPDELDVAAPKLSRERRITDSATSHRRNIMR